MNISLIKKILGKESYELKLKSRDTGGLDETVLYFVIRLEQLTAKSF